MTTASFRYTFLALVAGWLLPSAAAEEIVVGANIGNVPWEFAERGGEFVGFEIDLAREVAKRLGHTIRVENIPFNGLFPAVQSGRVAVALSSMTVTEKRLASVGFVQPYYDSAQSLTVHARSKAQGLDDMRGKIIGVDTGSTGDMWTTANADRYGFGEIRRYEGLAPAMLDLQSMRIDGYISDIPALQYYIKDKPFFRIAERIETGERYSMMFAKKSRWIAPFNEQIGEMKRDGFLAELHERWFGAKPAEDSATVMELPLPRTR